ncbi:MAG: GatB/YqeY domain-containing protein [Patescibacteria group bacterium]|nr:GatB/YqeY domain-containing protein [Patescibacteria group bacterium]
MSLTSRIKENLRKAIKEEASLKVSVLRMLSAALHNAEIASRGELSEEEEIEVISKEAKKRKESIEAYREGGREDLASKEEKELEIIEGYLPTQLSEQEIRDIIRKSIEDLGAVDSADLGKVMGAVMPKVKGRAEGSKVRELVVDILEG